MKDFVIYIHPIVGKITFQDLIHDLENLYEDNKKLEEILVEMLEKTNLDSEDISRIFNIANTSERLKFIIDLLNDEL